MPSNPNTLDRQCAPQRRAGLTAEDLDRAQEARTHAEPRTHPATYAPAASDEDGHRPVSTYPLESEQRAGRRLTPLLQHTGTCALLRCFGAMAVLAGLLLIARCSS